MPQNVSKCSRSWLKAQAVRRLRHHVQCFEAGSKCKDAHTRTEYGKYCLIRIFTREFSENKEHESISSDELMGPGKPPSANSWEVAGMEHCPCRHGPNGWHGHDVRILILYQQVVPSTNDSFKESMVFTLLSSQATVDEGIRSGPDLQDIMKPCHETRNLVYQHH